jgi:predicted ferric reductase
VNRWYWLLLVPIVVPLLTFLYNAEEPRVFGFPLFYWLQLAFVLLGSACCLIVYLRTKS